ncbi:hypothetical protein Tco_0077328 [Tanacetum coccineum]
MSANDKTGLGYDSQLNGNELNNSPMSQLLENVSESDEIQSNKDDSLVNNKYKTGEGYHAVPPPYTGNYLPLRPDLSFARLDDSVFNSVVSDIKTGKTEVKSNSDSDDEVEVKPVNKQPTHKQVEQSRNCSQSPRNNRRNWNEKMTHKIGLGYEFTKKACFVCGSLNHLIRDCNYHENRMVKEFVLKNVGKGTGQRNVRPAWNNIQKVNHQNFSSNLTHPHAKRNFVPSVVLTKTGKAAVPVSTARPVNTTASKSTVNAVKSRLNVFHKSHSPVRRHFYQITATKTYALKEKVNTVKVNDVTTAGSKVVVSDVQGNKVNVVKPSAC